MKRKISLVLLRIYDLLLALIFIWVGILMIRSNYGIFSEGFPMEFSDVLPFNSWVVPGVIFIIVFGVGNIVAFIYSFIKEDSHKLSLIMGCLTLLSIIMQIIIIGERYLATDQFLTLSIIQIVLSTVYRRLS